MTTPSTPDTDAPVLIAGAGLAGLTAARALAQRGVVVRIFEAADRPGGRVTTDEHPDGYLLDRGFQVLLDAYPGLRDQVDRDRLDLRSFDRGAVIWDGSTRHTVANPFSNPSAILSSLAAPVMTLRDRLLLAKLAARVRMADWTSATAAIAFPNAGGSAREFLEREGFSDRFVETFAAPFWGGITLDRSLGVSAGPLLFTLKMFIEGTAAIPARGVRALPEHLARALPEGSLATNARVEEILIEEGRAVGLRLQGEAVHGRAVIVATDPLSARSLTGDERIPDRGPGFTTVYLAGKRDPGLGKLLLLNGAEEYGVNHVAPMSAVAPSYAPAGQHLLAAAILDHPRLAGLADEGLMQLARTDTARMLGHAIEDWTPIHLARTPFAQFAQPPGFAARLPLNRTSTLGLYLAGEYTHDSSQNGAMLSGATAARLVAQDLRVTAAEAASSAA